MPYLSSLLNSHINSHMDLYKLKQKHALFYDKFNINLDLICEKCDEKKDNLFSPLLSTEQIGGDIFEINIDKQANTDKQANADKQPNANNYSFEYYKISQYTDIDGKIFSYAIIIKNQPTQTIISKTVDKTVDKTVGIGIDDISYKEFTASKHCALLLYDNKEVLKLALLNMNSNCYTNKTNDLSKKTGSTLLLLILSFARKHKFKKIVLSDQAQYTYTDNKYSVFYEIKYIHTLTHGKSWYAKFGFKFINQIDKEAQAHNKKIMGNLKTEDYPLDYLIRFIVKNIVDQRRHLYMDKYDYLESISKLVKLYDTYNGELFKHFIAHASKECCFIIAQIYMDIYKSLQLKEYVCSEMYLNL